MFFLDLHHLLEIAKKVGIIATLAGLTAGALVYPHDCGLDQNSPSFMQTPYLCHTLTGNVSLASDDFLSRFEISLVAFAAVAFGTFLILWIISRVARANRGPRPE